MNKRYAFHTEKSSAVKESEERFHGMIEEHLDEQKARKMLQNSTNTRKMQIARLALFVELNA